MGVAWMALAPQRDDSAPDLGTGGFLAAVVVTSSMPLSSGVIAGCSSESAIFE
jgi:hypothetical protein